MWVPMSAWAGSEHLSHEQENIHSDLSTAEINTLFSIKKYFDFAKKYFDFPQKRFLVSKQYRNIFYVSYRINNYLDLDR